MTATIEKLFEKTEAISKIANVGDIIEGKILSVSKRKIWVDLGQALGMIPAREIGSIDVNSLKIGDSIFAFILIPEDDEGNAILSLKRAGKERLWKNLETKHESKEILKAKVVDANKGGLMVEVDGVAGFLPASQLAIKNYPRVDGGDKNAIFEKLYELVGKTLDVVVLDFSKSQNKLIFSEKAAIIAAQKQQINDQYQVGQIIKGKVSGIVDFGIFVTFDNLEGLIHISEVDWGKVEDLNQFATVGDEIEAQIIGIGDDRISLSLKRLKIDPWLEKIGDLKQGDIIEGEVIRIVPFGAFVKINENIEGLAHISELSDKHLTDPSEVVIVGEKKLFKVISIDQDQHRVVLSLKQINA